MLQRYPPRGMGGTGAWILASAPGLRKGRSRPGGLRMLEPGCRATGPRGGCAVGPRGACLWAFTAPTLLAVARLVAPGDNRPVGT